MPTNFRPFFLSTPTGAFAPVGIDRTSRLAWNDVQRTDLNMKTGPAADPTNSHWLNKFHLSNDFKLLFGRVVDQIAYTNCYKVQVEKGITSLWCTAATQTALQPIGARQFGQIVLGAAVIFAMHPYDNFGIILGVIPEAMTNSRSSRVDFISQAGRSGLLVDDAHNYPIGLDGASLIIDWSSGRPFDATEGEFGQVTETGLMDFIDSFMTGKRVDEETGVWGFFHDQLLRIAGHNIQEWSAGYEREDLDDEGEIGIVKGYTPYYWEALGALVSDATVCRDVETEDWQQNDDLQGYSQKEPADDRQQAWYRLRDFYGYLGQAHKRVLNLPPTGEDELNLITDSRQFPGVFEENLSLTGRYSVRTAHEYVISKNIVQPVPKLVIRPEDPNGDNTSNYKAAGEFGSGVNHVVTGEMTVPGGEDTTQVKIAGYLDTEAFIFNWIGDHPFHYHEFDWYLSEEDDLAYIPSLTPPVFEDLQDSQFMTVPSAIPLNVDNRYGNVNYYPNHSYFALLDEGGIVLGCGFGAEIKIANGSIWITAPGDINFQSGRNIVSLAGNDLVMRAKNSWDLSATNRDGRIKAERNLWMVAAGECGGVLIQSKATQPFIDFSGTGEDANLGGIVIKAEDSLVSLCSRDLTLSLTHPEEEHTLILDAGYNGRLKFKSQFYERFMTNTGSAMDFWVTPGEDNCTGTITKGAEWWSDGTFLSNPLVVNGKLFVSDCGIFGTNVVAIDGHIVTSDAQDTFGKVGLLSASDQTTLTSTITYYQNRANTDLPTIGSLELTTLCDRQADYNGCEADFTFRSVGQYRTTNYTFFENRWQQMARIVGSSVNIWEESGVNDTYPYPGKENLLGATYKTLDLNLYNINTGRAIDRGVSYETPAYNSVSSVILNDNYLVIN